MLSVLFNFDRSCDHDWVLETTLGEKQVLLARKLSSMAEFTKTVSMCERGDCGW
nr:hypothetical protein [Cylindrospermopsis raciborskii]